jgi:nitrite reductase/ring-hydroxylating ferredoxin subunit/uncharacterized membrane protein
MAPVPFARGVPTFPESKLMRSKASVKGHPLHPALIPFPFAFLVGALLFDGAGMLFNRPALWMTAGHLTVAGVAAGLLAAIPGIIDYIYTVPPGSSGQKRATTHAIGNVIALGLFAASWLLRNPDGSPAWAGVLCEIAGGALLAYSASLGGTLVTRNQISVDHRYANAGKWQDERYTQGKGQPLVVGRADDLEPDQMKLLRINGHRIVLGRTTDGYTAFDDACTHRGGSLAGGVMIGGVVQCLWHGSQFGTTTGAVSCGPAKKKIRVYEVEVKDGKVLLVSPPG